MGISSAGVGAGPSRRRATRVILLAAALLSGGRWTTATGVDGAGRIVVVPLVMSDAHRESVLTLTNAGPEPLTIDALYVGATGTPLAGPHACKEQGLAPDGSTTVRLRDLCPDLSPKPDAEDFGYLELSSRGDSRLTFFATSTVETDFDRSFGIGGEPIGAFGPAADLGVSGLRALKPGDDESLRCYVGAFHQAKTVIVDLDDSNNNRLATRALSLAPREMQRIDLLPWLGLAATGQTNLRVRFLSFDDAVAIAGCAHEHTRTNVMTYQAAQSALATRDAARLRNVYVNHLLDAGPYQIGYPWIHTLTGGRADLKVILSTYLRSNDQVRCYVQPPPAPAFDSSPWLEVQVRDPEGNVVAGGNGIHDTGVFYTGHAGEHRQGQRWWIEVSFDEDAHAQTPFPRAQVPGFWGLRCDSAAGMSRPMGVDDGSNKDDF